MELFSVLFNADEIDLLTTFNKSETSPVASRITVAPTMNAIMRYDIVVSKMANKVPFGMAVCGSYLHLYMQSNF